MELNYKSNELRRPRACESEFRSNSPRDTKYLGRRKKTNKNVRKFAQRLRGMMNAALFDSDQCPR